MLAPGRFETEQICQVLRDSLTIYTYALNDGRIRELFFHIFCDCNFPVALLSGQRFSQLVPDNTQPKAQSSHKMRVPIALEAQLCIDAAALMIREV